MKNDADDDELKLELLELDIDELDDELDELLLDDELDDDELDDELEDELDELNSPLYSRPASAYVKSLSL